MTQTDPIQVISLSLVSTPLDTRSTLAELTGRLLDLGVGSGDCAAVELVLAEAINNIVEHAYADTRGPIKLTATLYGDGMGFEITDFGQPMPGIPRPAPPPLATSANALPEGGFGWHLIHSLTENTGYARIGGKNRLTFEVVFKQADPWRRTSVRNAAISPQ